MVHNYMKMLAAHLPVPQAKEITTDTTYQEDEEAENCKQIFIRRSSSQTADLSSDRLIRLPLDDSEIHLEPEPPQDPPKSIQELEVEKIELKVRVPFERKKFDLSIYTFDEISIDQSFE